MAKYNKDDPVLIGALAYDALVDVRRAMRILRATERRLASALRAERRKRRAKSNEWNEAARIREEERLREANHEARRSGD